MPTGLPPDDNLNREIRPYFDGFRAAQQRVSLAIRAAMREMDADIEHTRWSPECKKGGLMMARWIVRALFIDVKPGEELWLR